MNKLQLFRLNVLSLSALWLCKNFARVHGNTGEMSMRSTFSSEKLSTLDCSLSISVDFNSRIVDSRKSLVSVCQQRQKFLFLWWRVGEGIFKLNEHFFASWMDTPSVTCAAFCSFTIYLKRKNKLYTFLAFKK